MSKPKWYNPTDDGDYNTYYKVAWLYWGTVFLIAAAIIVVGGIL